MATLPNKKALSFLFTPQFQIKNIHDINRLFFRNSSPFFSYIAKYYKKEGEEFIKVFPFLLNLVSGMDKIFNNNKIVKMNKIPKLKTGDNGGFDLTRKQVALIFFLSFLNLIDVKNDYNMNTFKVSDLLFLNYNSAIQFGRCFLNYLTVIGKWIEQNNTILEEKIIYKRENKPHLNYLESDENIPLCELKLENKGSLFDGDASYCVDFANEYIGGGALSGGCVQEEILFAIEPELTVSMFFMEVMNDNDAIGIFNTIQYSKYDGYGYNFTYAGSLIDENSEIKKHKIIAIDAMDLRRTSYFYFHNQISKNEINRDIHKAYVGFNLINFDKTTKKTIATGNWGCGAFNGNHELKFLQQWIAASYAKIERLDYYTFGKKEMKIVEENIEKIKNKFKNVKELYSTLISVCNINDHYIENILKYS